MFRTIPAHITPGPNDVADLNARREALASRLDQQAHRERAIVAGTASTAMLDAAIADKHLSRVLAGPVPMYYGPRTFKHGQRGRALLGLVLVFAVLGVVAAAALDRIMTRPVACAEVAQRYRDAPEGSPAEIEALAEMDRGSCYAEDAD